MCVKSENVSLINQVVEGLCMYVVTCNTHLLVDTQADDRQLWQDRVYRMI